MKNKSNILLSRLPCPCGLSSDAYTLYDDGHGYCYSGSCKSPYHKNSSGEATTRTYGSSQVEKEPMDTSKWTYEYLPLRGITADTLRVYKAPTAIDETGKPHSVGFIYPNGGSKARLLHEKAFPSKGMAGVSQLYGMDKFPPGSNRCILITEGEFDAMSAYQMLQGVPAVSIRGAGSAVKDCAENHKYLDSFEKIYLCLDDDEAGRKAATGILDLFAFNKVFFMPLGKMKDANNYLEKGATKEFRSIFFNAKNFMPEGIISGHDEFLKALEEAKAQPMVPYPSEKLQAVTRGIKESELILVTAQTGIGKTEFIRWVQHHLLTTTDANIATIHMEETVADQLKRMASYDLKTPAHFEGNASNEEISEALKRITRGSNERYNVYTHPDVDDPDAIIEAVRFLVKVRGCKYVFLDHISQMVSALDDKDERKILDYISTKFARMVKNLNFTMFLISHVNDNGETRGSRYIEKVCNTRIDLSRDKLAADDIERNKMYLALPKNRSGATTGPGGVLAFDPETFTMSEYTPPIVSVPA